MNDQVADELLQRARNIAADTFIAIEIGRGKKPSTYGTFREWGQHIDDYTKFMREGSYDDGIAVQSALAALKA